MMHDLFLLSIFILKALIIVILILALVAGILMIVSRSKEKFQGKICIKNLNKKFEETTDTILEEILPKKLFKKHLKEQKAAEKTKSKQDSEKRNLFVLNFQGDIKASAVTALREEVTAVLGVAKPTDEVVVRVESAGGMVHAYGLAAMQLQRFREQKIPLTVVVDKVAASGGYLMACIANKLLAAPFSIIGSIGVIVQIPNFHRLLKEKHIDFEQLTAGSFKRTLTMFGHNTEEGREKLKEEIEDIHQLFKNLIHQYRQQVDIEKISTGEHWLGSQALDLKLVDELTTSDDYLFLQSKNANVYEISYHVKKSLASKLTSSVSLLKEQLFEKDPIVRI